MLIKEPLRRISKENGIWYVNNSSLDLIQSCPRKAQYVFDKPESEIKTIPLDFGTAIHAALKVFYATSIRSDATFEEMISVFNAHASPQMKAIEEGEIHSLSNGALILKTFYETYKNDPWVVYVDEHGPFVERTFEVSIADNLKFFGTIDTMLKNSETNELCIVDHKAVRALGQAFAQKADVNHQLTGYIFAAQQLGIEVNKGMFQGLKKVKTAKSMESMRSFIQRSPEAIEEWKAWVYHTITVWEMMRKTGNYPMNGSYECNKFSGCQYLSVCAAPIALRENILKEMNAKTEEIEE